MKGTLEGLCWWWWCSGSGGVGGGVRFEISDRGCARVLPDVAGGTVESHGGALGRGSLARGRNQQCGGLWARVHTCTYIFRKIAQREFAAVRLLQTLRTRRESQRPPCFTLREARGAKSQFPIYTLTPEPDQGWKHKQHEIDASFEQGHQTSLTRDLEAQTRWKWTDCVLN